ncbi:hypothetical protein ACFL0V_01275 [Nanoarchaeota archaeon]
MPAKKTKKRSTSRKPAKKTTSKKVTDKDVENYFKRKFKSCCSSKSSTSSACKTHCSCSSAVYGLGFVGAAIYYISTATGFWMGVWGVIKAILWPAFLIFYAMKSLGM